MLRHEDSHSRRIGGVTQSPLHVEFFSNLPGERFLQRRARHIEVRRLKFDPHEQYAALPFGGMLIKRRTIRAVTVQKAGNSRYDAGTIRTTDKKSGRGFAGGTSCLKDILDAICYGISPARKNAINKRERDKKRKIDGKGEIIGRSFTAVYPSHAASWRPCSSRSSSNATLSDASACSPRSASMRA